MKLSFEYSLNMKRNILQPGFGGRYNIFLVQHFASPQHFCGIYLGLDLSAMTTKQTERNICKGGSVFVENEKIFNEPYNT